MGKRTSVKRERRLTCEHEKGKVIYSNRKLARGAAALARKDTEDRNINEFRCRVKSHFHIGHDNFNKSKTPVRQNQRTTVAPALVNSAVAAVPSQPERPRVSRPVRPREKPVTLVGVVVRPLFRQTAERETTCEKDEAVTISL